MPTETSTTPTDEFAQLLVDARAAATILSDTIQQENEVLLGFCNGLFLQTLKASTELNRMTLDMAKEGAAKKAAKAQEKSSKAVAAAAKTAQDSVAASSTNGSKSPAKKEAAIAAKTSQDLANGFIDAMLTTMKNSVRQQEQMFILAQASTTMTIQQIWSMDSTALALTFAHILDDK
ncbi:RebB family R body protein [Crocinitomicaceae bacterium]|nr:RebB family R body protein [Crocinitomicaceae bacterium]MDB3907142.1 RebB family R body protein [Crocinitomicaceae bacterium]